MGVGEARVGMRASGFRGGGVGSGMPAKHPQTGIAVRWDAAGAERRVDRERQSVGVGSDECECRRGCRAAAGRGEGERAAGDVVSIRDFSCGTILQGERERENGRWCDGKAEGIPSLAQIVSV